MVFLICRKNTTGSVSFSVSEDGRTDSFVLHNMILRSPSLAKDCARLNSSEKMPQSRSVLGTSSDEAMLYNFS